MNRIHEPVARALGPILKETLARFPVVIVTGARQTGKTTLVQSFSEHRAFQTLDDFDTLDRARTKPQAFIEEADRLTIDEVQREPRLLRAIKLAVDRERRPGRFLLTGSANLLLMRRVSESLAGRAIYLTLWPMDEAEKDRRAGETFWHHLDRLEHIQEGRNLKDWQERVRAGGYPEPALTMEGLSRTQWFESYIRTYLERDLQDLASISALTDFRRVMKLSALRIGQLVNQSDLARDASLPQPTVHRYLNLLEASYQIVRVPAFGVNRTKRLVKAPKVYWSDPGLAAHLRGSVDTGALLENLVLTSLLVWRETVPTRPEIFYWRTTIGREVDFVVEIQGKVFPIEVKSGTNVGTSDLASIREFLAEYKSITPAGVVLYNGNRLMRLEKNLWAVPLGTALGVK